jgi:hypothetical protein
MSHGATWAFRSAVCSYPRRLSVLLCSPHLSSKSERIHRSCSHTFYGPYLREDAVIRGRCRWIHCPGAYNEQGTSTAVHQRTAPTLPSTAPQEKARAVNSPSALPKLVPRPLGVHDGTFTDFSSWGFPVLSFNTTNRSPIGHMLMNSRFVLQHKDALGVIHYM